jgi:dephospho-CoA kinase
MSAWPEKYVIGLTGNIATGKSVVRKMLEHLGAYGIDADALAHRAVAPDAPAYRPVVETFGTWVIGPDAQIDRGRLGRIVFSDPEALARLEAIIHPFVRQAIDVLVRRAQQRVIVLEAIKLLEGELRAACDAIWVTDAPAEVQQARLVRKRNLSQEVARQRILAQAPQAEKRAAADVIIRNAGSFEDAWRQVLAAWQETVPVEAAGVQPQPVQAQGQLHVERAGPRQAQEIADFITRLSKGKRPMNRADVMEAFGEKAYLVLKRGEKLVGLAGWQVENLIARTADIYLEPGLPLEEAMRVLLNKVETASRELQSEASLLFLPAELAHYESVWQALNYEPRAAENLDVRAWQEAARESMPSGAVLLFKPLRKDRVLRPV